ncbi:threonine/serine dehydratase [Reyranella sp. CPCC 100927]|uniref:threonine/serine dehydratase n=1 Tax=Reyranella sp. CPCC 100927 TaxID=2599616 RepID=UPI0011B54E19|nr:threonine/serine dehydratase [Reyranella sp. CPCC 100927]TWT09987.1 threonine/serine dehydratase [Reyranella sp. CPCC 100927]
MIADAPTASDIEETERLIRPYIRQTPLIGVAGADVGVAAARLLLKLEFLQHAGSFKSRGAFTHLLGRSVPAAGVVAASGGNHGAAVAYAAMKLGIPARIFVPTVAAAAKVEQIRSYGAQLTISGERYADALAASERWIEQTGALAIHAFDHVATLKGQGTVGLELDRQAADIDTLLVAVGGGGLIGGIAAWYRGRVKLVGVEPSAAPTLTRALAHGGPVDAEAGGVAADSLAPRRVGQLVYPLAAHYVAQTVLVADDAIVRAQDTLWRALRIVTEPGGAAAFAALESGAYVPAPDERVGVLLCGANSDAVTFALPRAA